MPSHTKNMVNALAWACLEHTTISMFSRTGLNLRDALTTDSLYYQFHAEHPESLGLNAIKAILCTSFDSSIRKRKTFLLASSFVFDAPTSTKVSAEMSGYRDIRFDRWWSWCFWYGAQLKTVKEFQNAYIRCFQSPKALSAFNRVTFAFNLTKKKSFEWGR